MDEAINILPEWMRRTLMGLSTYQLEERLNRIVANARIMSSRTDQRWTRSPDDR
jgi:hypothetical protein